MSAREDAGDEAAVERRLADVARRSPLDDAARARIKVGMSGADVERRLRRVAELVAVCRWLGAGQRAS